jgi:hypothetical protein
MNMWYDLVSIVENLVLQDDSDQIIWSFSSNGKYSVQSLYAVINHRGVVPVYVPAVWKLKIPLRVQIFLWLLYKNKILTRDSLAKRREVSDKTCLFCNEPESVCHLFFECCVVNRLWPVIAEILNLRSDWNFEVLATFWIPNKRHAFTNIISSAVTKCVSRGLLGQGKDGAVMDTKDAKKMETTVRAGPGNHGGLGDTSSGEQSKPATENLLGWRNEIKVGSIDFTTFGTGLCRCDSV